MPDPMENFTQRGRRVMSQAQAEAENLNDAYVDMGHFLIALTNGGGLAARVLADLGVTEAKARAIAAEIQRDTPERPEGEPVMMSLHAQKLLELAEDEARRMQTAYAGTEHLLLGWARVDDEDRTLIAVGKAGFNILDIRRRTRRAIQEGQVQEPAKKRASQWAAVTFTIQDNQDVTIADFKLSNWQIASIHNLVVHMEDYPATEAQTLTIQYEGQTIHVKVQFEEADGPEGSSA